MNKYPNPHIKVIGKNICRRNWAVFFIIFSLIIISASSNADDYPEEEIPEPPPNTRPYMLEPPFNVVVLGEEFEWEGRVAVEDNDTVEWNLITNMTEDDYSEFEWWPEDYSFKLKIKTVQVFVRWVNLSVTDNLFPAAYWNWTLFCVEDVGTRGDEQPSPREHNSDFYWCGSACGGDGYQWDVNSNWRISPGWTIPSVGDYPKDADDRAFFNETADALYLVHGANSVVTIGELKLSSGFTGLVIMSIDLVVDDSGAHGGHIEVSAGSWDTNATANKQINMDGNLDLLSTGTFTAQAGTLIIQGARAETIKVQSTNTLYKFTTDTASTVADIYDNLTAFQITIGAGTTYKMDAVTRGYELWTNFTDAASCGFVGTSVGILQLVGANGGRGANITTADATPPPTNYWTAQGSNGFTFISDNSTLSYYYALGYSRAWTWNVANTTFTRSNFYVETFTGSTITKFRDNTIDNNKYGFYNGIDGYVFENIVVTNTVYTDIRSRSVRTEFTNSNFNTADVAGDTTWSVISSTHNDVANAYKIICTTLSKSSITTDYASGDDVQVVAGTFTIDETSASDDYTVDSGAILVLDTAITHTFDTDANLTNNGILKTDGTMTTSSGYFDIYTPGNLWLNNSTVSNADLNYYLGGFNFSVGKGANSTLTDFSFEAPSGQDFAINFTSINFSAKSSGIVYHYNATVSSGTAKATVSNLTASTGYDLYVDSVLDQELDTDASGDTYYAYDSWSTKHFYLTYIGERIPDVPGAGVLTGVGATFDYVMLDESTIEFRAEVLGNAEGRKIPLRYYWEFSDGTTSNEKNPIKSFDYMGFNTDVNATLTICTDRDCSHPVNKDIHLIRWWLVGLTMALIIAPIITVIFVAGRVRR